MATEVVVATLNVHGRGPTWGVRSLMLIEELATPATDAIALQELRTFPSQGQRLAAALTVRTSAPYRFAGARKRGIRGYEGIGVITRLPILERGVLPLGAGGRVALRCRLAAGDQSFDFWSVHFQHGGSGVQAREAAAGRLLAEVRDDVPAVLAGDLNSAPGSRPLEVLHAKMGSAHALAHGSEPASTVMPLERGTVLDYILVGEGIEVLDCRLAFERPGEDGGTISDHAGLVARLRL